MAKKKKERKKFTWKERKEAVKAYQSAPHGTGKDVLKEHGVSYSLVHYWMANPECMRASAKR